MKAPRISKSQARLAAHSSQGPENQLTPRESQRIIRLAMSQSEEQAEGVDELAAAVREQHAEEQEEGDEEEEEVDYGSESDGEPVDFHIPGSETRSTLADMIMAQMSKPSSSSIQPVAQAAEQAPMNPKLVQVYSAIGELFSRYKSGPIPKPFKILPSVPNPFLFLDLTDPPNWTPQAMYQAIKVLSSGMKDEPIRWIYQGILLPRFRNDVAAEGKISPHIFDAIKKSLYKPKAFFKGFLLPLAFAEDMPTLKEAAIVSSILTKISIPAQHSSAALLKLLSTHEDEYNPFVAVIIRTLYDKKYALPFRTIDASVEYFMFHAKNDKSQKTVLHYQAMLAFIQRYKEDITPPQKDALLDALKGSEHPVISALVREEIVHSKSRDEGVLDIQLDE